MLKVFERDKKPVAMFEYNVDEADMGGRKARYWQSGGTGNLPLVMVNSGREVAWGAQSPGNAEAYHKKYGGMIDTAKAERPAAEVKAWYKRSTLDKFKVQVDVTNVGSAALDPYADKPAQVVVFVIEDIELVHMTRTARAVQYLPLDDELKPGQTVHLEGEVAPTKGTNFNKSRVVVVVEYGDEDGWDLAGGAWGQAGERPAVVPPTATDVPPPTATYPPIIVPPTQPPPTDVPPTEAPPTEAPRAQTRFFSYLPVSLYGAALGEQ